MKLIAKIILGILINAAAFLAAAKWIPGVELSADIRNVLIAAFVLSKLDWVVKPIMRMLFGPFILLTFGLGLIVLNALILYTLDYFFDSLTILTTTALLQTTLLVSALNFVFHMATKK